MIFINLAIIIVAMIILFFLNKTTSNHRLMMAMEFAIWLIAALVSWLFGRPDPFYSALFVLWAVLSLPTNWKKSSTAISER